MVNALDNIAKYFDTQIVMPLQQTLVARRLIPVNTAISYKGIGMQTVDYWKFNDLSDAIINYEIQEHNEDTVDFTSTTLKMPVIKQDYTIGRRAYESFLAGLHGGQSIPVDASAAQRSAYKVALREDELLLDGWKPDGTNYEIKGLYNLANNSETTDSLHVDDAFGNMVKKVAKAIALLENDKIYGPYNMVVDPTVGNLLLGSISTTGFPEIQLIQKMLQKGPTGFPTDIGGMGGNIFTTPVMNSVGGVTTGAGMITPVMNPTYMDLIIAQDARNTLGFDSKQVEISPIYGSVYESLALRLKFTDAVCAMTHLSS